MGFDLHGNLSQIDRIDEKEISPVVGGFEIFPMGHVFTRDGLTRYGGGAEAFVKLSFLNGFNLCLNA